MSLARAIAFYLPQFHPIPENDLWWGKGFTEWTNVTKARPLFHGHYQPRLPADLGFYDLRLAEVRQQQADMARAAGIEAFCYWHYWFEGDRLLERPFNEVLVSGEPDFPFCLGWANASWTGIWYGAENRVLKPQNYPGADDYARHFDAILPALRDPRYLRVEGRPVFVLFRPNELPSLRAFSDQWREHARQAGLPGLHLIGIWGDGSKIPTDHGFDGATLFRLHEIASRRLKRPVDQLQRTLRTQPGWRKLMRNAWPRPKNMYRYEEAMQYFVEDDPLPCEYYPTVIPDFDNTARSGMNGFILHGSTPDLYRQHLRCAVSKVQELPEQRRLVFIKSWNEWAEGNYLEPDRKWGHAYLDVTRDELLAPLE